MRKERQPVFYRICLLVCLMWQLFVGLTNTQARAETGAPRDTATVLLVFLRDGGQRVPLKKNELPWPLKYSVHLRVNKAWLPSKDIKQIPLETDSSGNAIGVIDLPRGEYRIRGRTSYEVGLSCSQRFTIGDADIGRIRRIHLLHKRADLKRCALTVMSERGGTITVRVYPAVGVIPLGVQDPKYRTTRKLSARSGIPVTMYVWDDIETLRCTVSEYLYLDGRGLPQKKVFPVEQLSKGARWKLDVRKPTATLDVFLRTERDTKPLTEARWKEAFPDTPVPRLTCELLEMSSDPGGLLKTRDGGAYDWESGRFKYTMLAGGRTYVFPQFVRAGVMRLPVLSGEGKLVKKVLAPSAPSGRVTGTSIPSLGTIIIGARPPRKWRVHGVVKDDEGTKLSGATVSLIDAFGRPQNALTDAHGQYSFVVVEGTYNMSVFKPRSYPKSRSLELSKNMTVDWVLKEMPSMVVSLPGIRDRKSSLRVSLFNGIRGSGWRRSSLSREEERATFWGVPRGEYLVYAWCYPKSAKLGDISPSAQRMWLSKVVVEDKQKNQVNAHLAEPKRVTLAVSGKPDLGRVLIILWYRWRDSFVPIIAANRVDLANLIPCVIPASGEYVAEVVQKAVADGRDDTWKGGIAFYSKPFRVEATDKKLKVTLIKTSRHAFNPWSEPNPRLLKPEHRKYHQTRRSNGVLHHTGR